ncbi:MAG TPA: hypothetical protein VK644_14090 [Chitinophagaceae bacterium]|jgi:hypothetical protein|nr:hypothetical protein [Chitinophagaceae bacterium]
MNTASTEAIPGEYYLRGIPEMASGFKLNADNSFEFFLVYGALDRLGSGKWSVEKNQVVFNSKSWSGKDFALIQSKKTADEGITIRITDNNESLLRYMHASTGSRREDVWEDSDEHGIIKLPASSSTSMISLVFEFCPERISIFTIEGTEHNYFEFRIEPWLTEFFFKDFRLMITNEGFHGPHPMILEKEFDYVKKK